MNLEELRRLMEEGIPFNRMLGMKLTLARKNFVRLEVPFRDDLVGDPLRPALHGGVLSALADTAGGAAVWASSDDEVRISTIDLRVDYLRPAKLELVVAEAHVVRIGNRVGVVDVRLFHPSSPDDTIATGKAVYSIRAARSAAPA